MNPSHDYLRSLIQAAEELGVTIQAVDGHEVRLTRQYGSHHIDITIHAGPLLTSSLLRVILAPVEPLTPER